VSDSLSESIFQRIAPATFELPIFPLGSVLFPGGTIALKIFETRYMDMAKSCLKNAQPFGIALIAEGNEVGTPATPHAIGTVARITDWDMPDLGVLRVTVSGEARFRITEQRVEKSGLIIAIAENIAPDIVSEAVYEGVEFERCAQFLKNVLAQVGTVNSSYEESKFADAGWVSFRLTEILPFNNIIKQKMLELTDARMRLEVLYRFLRDQQLIRN
jgi:uncharacterized protein